MKTSVKMDVDGRGRPSTTRKAQSVRRRQLEKLSLVDVDREKCSSVDVNCQQSMNIIIDRRPLGKAQSG